MKTYIMHYKPLEERKSHILKLILKLGLKAKFITEYDREELDINDKRFIQKPEIWNIEIALIKNILLNNIIKNKNISIKSYLYWNFIKNIQNLYIPSLFRFRKISLAEISLTLKHYAALKEISKSNKPGLIIEDDVLLKKETKNLISTAFELCEKEFDYIDLGGGCDLPLYQEDIAHPIKKGFFHLKIPRSRTTAAYMINPKAASILVKNIFPISIHLDWKYQYIFIKENFKVSWTVPSAFLHGSESVFHSAIR